MASPFLCGPSMVYLLLHIYPAAPPSAWTTESSDYCLPPNHLPLHPSNLPHPDSCTHSATYWHTCPAIYPLTHHGTTPPCPSLTYLSIHLLFPGPTPTHYPFINSFTASWPYQSSHQITLKSVNITRCLEDTETKKNHQAAQSVIEPRRQTKGVYTGDKCKHRALRDPEVENLSRY